MAWSGLDQRGFPRIAVQCDILIREGSTEVIKTKTENLGGGGVCVILGQPLEKFSKVRLRVTLEPGQASGTIACDGRVVWTVRSKDPATQRLSYDTGIEFVNLAGGDETAILRFTEAHLSRQLHSQF